VTQDSRHSQNRTDGADSPSGAAAHRARGSRDPGDRRPDDRRPDDRRPDDRGHDAGRLPLHRRRFLEATAAAGGAVAAGPLLAHPALAQDTTAQAGTGTAAEAGTGAGHEAAVTLTVNGSERTATVDTRTSLLDLLRERLGVTGPKKGCNQGACGACTVLLDDRRTNSCLTLAVMHDGAEVTTVEGLADGDDLHPLQQAFIDRDAFQCGYCTPGQLVSGVACIAEGHTGSRAEIREWMSGNICRCGAYTNIVTAIAQTADRK
jgi:xanthine dehydrogenase YagT iron-sulfur-binding subunit